MEDFKDPWERPGGSLTSRDFPSGLPEEDKAKVVWVEVGPDGARGGIDAVDEEEEEEEEEDGEHQQWQSLGRGEKSQHHRGRIPLSDPNVISLPPCEPSQSFPATSRIRASSEIMGSFMEDLWSSIFTPGPTHTLLVATNVTFAALQTLLFALLLATYSIHFVALSALSGALWWSINWFARELRQVQAAEAAEAEKRAQLEEPEEEEEDSQSDSNRKTPGALEHTESDTETEVLAERKDVAPISPVPRSPAASATLRPPVEQSQVRKRLSVSGDSSGYGSTDSEWEKVDDDKTT
ncbi:Pkr1-domain-containing protein [Aspergillus heteromorphus CBS 117.55]|uniref:Pkr1-domain-containing protein n=1 Tax=Aspergillus heteromorphus CBS 117.55 TaxID=1448321 RepID=A0A317VD56_9EURO|nr:Pkr1-domain-containing protein [Aspergillus heteromorphus CBS 117.55]PWY70938.1 Pkr1-domain-containing protein [Aspergillus heteromorphus CBS 117.55]